MKWLTKAAPYLVGGVVLFSLGSWIYSSGSHSGASSVQKLWDEEKAKQVKEIDRLKTEYNTMELIHRAEIQRINDVLTSAEKDFEIALTVQRATSATRLLESSDRADVYQRQAESGLAESKRLASHAAKLDRSLTEGRQLVEQLRSTLRFRDQQLKELGAQIMSDRALLNTEGATNGN